MSHNYRRRQDIIEAQSSVTTFNSQHEYIRLIRMSLEQNEEDAASINVSQRFGNVSLSFGVFRVLFLCSLEFIALVSSTIFMLL